MSENTIDVRISKQKPKQSSQKNIERAEHQLELAMSENNFYEALQVSRTLYWRFCEQNQNQRALDLLKRMADYMMAHSQESSLYDICILIAGLLDKTHTAITQDILACALPYLDALHNPLYKKRYINALLKWSQHVGTNARGDERIHSAAAKSYCLSAASASSADETTKTAYQTGALSHFIHASIDDYEAFANLLIVTSMSKDQKDDDYLACKAVMQLLCLFDLKKANKLFSCYTEKHPAVGKPPFRQNSLLQFMYCLLLMAERDCSPLFERVKKDNITLISKHPELNAYLEKIGEVIFKIYKPQQGGLLGNFLSSLMSGGTDDE